MFLPYIYAWYYALMAYSHWPEPRPGQGPGTNGLYNIVWKLSHYTVTWDRSDTYCLSFSVPGPGPVRSSTQCE